MTDAIDAPDGTYAATVDRIVDGATAVVLLEADGDVVAQADAAVEVLPEEGRHEGAVFEVVVADGRLADLRYRPDEERERREALRDRFDRLSKRLPDDES